jgi:hypothetical protein
MAQRRTDDIVSAIHQAGLQDAYEAGVRAGCRRRRPIDPVWDRWLRHELGIDQRPRSPMVGSPGPPYTPEGPVRPAPRPDKTSLFPPRSTQSSQSKKGKGDPFLFSKFGVPPAPNLKNGSAENFGSRNFCFRRRRITSSRRVCAVPWLGPSEHYQQC